MSILKKTLNTTAIAAVALAMAFSVSTAKAEDAGTNITATVQNAITWDETQPLAFGTIVAISDASDTSTLVIDTTGADTFNNPGNARLVRVSGGQQGIFDASNAAPNTQLTLTLPTTVTLNCAACSGSQPDFLINNFTDDAGGAPTTDGTGAVTVNIGATLNTIASANAYEDGLYSGAYTVSINY